MRGDKFPNLVRLVDQLRGPDGCPWDRQQSFDTLKPMLLEEAYEVLEAMDTNDHKAFCDELGDLLFQIVFLSQIAEAEGFFDKTLLLVFVVPALIVLVFEFHF